MCWTVEVAYGRNFKLLCLNIQRRGGSVWFKLYFLCIPTHEELQLQVFTDMYDIQNEIQKKVS